MRIVGVTAVGMPAKFSTELEHAQDPNRLALEYGYEIVRPLSAIGELEKLTLTVQLRPSKRQTNRSARRRKSLIEPGLKLEDQTLISKRQRIAAYVILASEKGVLGTQFAKRTIVRGLWGLPGGGIEPGETPLTAVRREVFEESSQEVTNARLLDMQSEHLIGRSPDGNVEDFHALRIVYSGYCSNPSEAIVQEINGTTAQSRWIPFENWRSMQWTPSARQLLRKHLPGIRKSLSELRTF